MINSTFDIMAMLLGYFVILLVLFGIFIVGPIIIIGQNEARKNKEIYKREMIKRYESHK